MSQTVYFNGEYLLKERLAISPDDRGFLFGDGVYEVARAYGGSVFAMQRHLDRLAYGVRETAIGPVNVGELGVVATTLLEHNGLSGRNATIYIQVTRGSARRTHAFPDPAVAPTVYMTASPFSPPYDMSAGVAVITVPDIRWARCDIKSIQLLPNCMANQRAKSAGAQEALFVRDGVVLEGSHSSVFFVVDGEVRTAPKSNYILPGITRDTVVELCVRTGIPLRETPVFLDDMLRATEVFLAGTTMDVMPVVRVDGRTVGSGVRGPVTTELQDLFRGETGGVG